MDTLSHSLVGVSIAQVAIATQNVEKFEDKLFVLSFCVIAANIPDVDILTKPFGSRFFLKYHRSISHSLFLNFILTILYSLIAYRFNDSFSIYFILGLSTLSVFGHIFTDIFNSYGTQALWPFSTKWLRLGLSSTFDTFIFFSLATSIAVDYFTDWYMVNIYLINYCLIFLYLTFSLFKYMKVKQKLFEEYDDIKKFYIYANRITVSYFFIIELESARYIIGKYINKIRVIDEVKKNRVEPILFDKLIQNKNLQHFIDFCPIYNVEEKRLLNGYRQIKYYDLRYVKNDETKRKYYWFSTTLILKGDEVINSYMGFIMKEHKLIKKLNLN